MNLDEAVEIVRASPDHRVIERLPIKSEYHKSDGSEKKLAAYLDTETTGFNTATDRVIELAIVVFEYGPDGRVYRIVDTYDEYQDPGFPIPEEITKITGITNEMVAGKSLNLERLTEILNQVVVVIAHNAQFDRNFVEQVSPLFKEKCWACSIADIPWREEGLESSKLEYLAYRYGFFYEGHRADIDCYAGLHLLTQRLPTTGRNALSVLLESAKAPRFKVLALRSPFDTKDKLKSRGYRWETVAPDQKCWVATVLGEYLEEEKAFLEADVYSNGRPAYEVKRISPFSRFSDRS